MTLLHTLLLFYNYTFSFNVKIIFSAKCPADTFLDVPGATSSSDCNACSAKIAINMVTLDREFGSASSSDCVCNARFLDIGKYDDQGNLRAIDARCIDCPDGANCTNAGAALNQVDSLEGFWRADWTSYQFFPCLKVYF